MAAAASAGSHGTIGWSTCFGLGSCLTAAQVVVAVASENGPVPWCTAPLLSGGWRPEFIEQHRQGFTQLEPVAGGVGEQESALRNKASILD